LDWSFDGAALLYSFGQPRAIGFLDLNSGQKSVLVQRPNALSSASFCPLGRCIVFTESLDGIHSRLWLVPLRGHVAAPQTEWVPLTDGQFADDKARLSADGTMLYFYSNRDGFYCLWKLRVDHAVNYRKPVPLLHLHSAGFSLRELPRSAFDLRVAADKLVLNIVSTASNLWMTELRPQ
jgi:hypothetical protein